MAARLNRWRFFGRPSTWSDAARGCSWDEAALVLPPLELSAGATRRVVRGRDEAPWGRIALVEDPDCHSAIASRVTSLAGICRGAGC
ncbi:hypothetical protein IMZ48_41410 [Candidatus Bathyarchaeota archaeon]|nr:hypothetical protein [Candidatus Bathyarchaeota archaeon]